MNSEIKETIIWAAGFFDGEGSKNLSCSHQRYRLQVHITNSDEKAIDVFALWGGGRTFKKDLAGTVVCNRKINKDVFRIVIPKSGVYKFLKDLEPYLRVKKEQCSLAIQFIEKTKVLRTLRIKGHSLCGIDRQYRKKASECMKRLNKGKQVDELPGIEPAIKSLFSLGAAGRETRTGFSAPAFSPSRVGLAVIAVPAAPPPIKETSSKLAEPATGRQKCILTRLCMARGIKDPLEEQPMSIGEAGMLIRELSKRGRREPN